MGDSHRKLGIPGEEGSRRAASPAATCDAAFFRDKKIAVVGGGDSAFEEAIFLSKFGSTVELIHRRPEFRASQIMQRRARRSKTSSSSRRTRRSRVPRGRGG